MRVAPDDEVYRVNTVWLGPRGLTFPWTARYLAYAVWLLTFLIVIGFEAVTPLRVGLPPVWEICVTTLFTYAVMGLVDHDRPVVAVWQTFVADLSAPRRSRPSIVVTSTRKVRIRHADRHEEPAVSSAAISGPAASGPAASGPAISGPGVKVGIRTGAGRRVRAPRKVG